jgi:hypothetical protein
MKSFLLFIATGLTILNTNAQSFNGTVDFKYATMKDTTNNVYIVKDKIIKLDQFSKKTGNIEGSFIFDLGVNTIKFVNPKRKVWGEHKSETPAAIKGKCEVTKGTGSKTIQGLKCVDYTVKNTDENTIITYWVATDKLNFFMPVLKLWNRKDKQSVYFAQITGLSEGSMPLMSEEKQISDGKSLTRLEVTKITKKMPDEASVSVPPEFTKFDK